MHIYLYVTAVFSAMALYLWRSKRNVLGKPEVASVVGLHPSESRYYREYFEHSPDAVFVVEALRSGGFRFERLNPFAADCIDPSGAGIQGRTLDDVANGAVGTERKRVLRDLAIQLVNSVKTGKPSRYEGKFLVDPDAECNVYNFSLFPLDDKDGTSRILCFARDISVNKLYEHEILRRSGLDERLTESAVRRSEDALNKTLKHHVDAQRLGKMGSWVLDAVTSELTWSEEIYSILELDPAVFRASRKTFLNTIHPDDRDAAGNCREASLTSNARSSFDYRFALPDGRIKYIRECVETIREAGANPRYSHGIVQDITSFKLIENQLKDTQDRLRELVVDHELHREDERKRIAWELHEELGQLLAAVKMRMSSLRSHLQKSDPVQAEDSRAVIQLVDSSIRTVHDIVSELRPTVLFHGVAAALEWLVAKFNKHPGFECELVIEEDDRIFVSDEMTTLVFRITQEALENAKRHTSVTRVVVSWVCSKDYRRWSIQHDGANIFTELSDNKSLAIFGMQERVAAFGGEMQVFSTFDQGAVIEASFPHN